MVTARRRELRLPRRRLGAAARGRPRAAALALLVVAAILAAIAPARAEPPAYDWVLVSKTSPPASMHPGTKLDMTVVVRNAGSATWRSDEAAGGFHPVRLGTTGPRDRSSAFATDDPTWLWSGGTRVRMVTPVVAPGEHAVFTFTFTAPALPAYPASFDERFAPVAEGVAWMDASDIAFATTVRPVSTLPAVPNAGSPPPPCIPLAHEGEGARAPSHRDALPPGAAAGHRFGTPVAQNALTDPRAMTLDPVGKLIVADAGANRVRRIDPSGFELFTWGSAGSGPGQFSSPSGVAVVPATGQVFVADTGNHRIQRFSLGGVFLGAFGGAAQFSSPRGLAYIATGPYAGALAVADSGNHRVLVVSQGGATLATIGGPGSDPGRFSLPRGVAAYGDHVFVADTGNDRVQRFRLADGAFAGAWGGRGSATGCMRGPAGIAADASGVYVADTGNDRIQHFTRTGAFLDGWGSTGSATGQLSTPSSIALAAGSVVWVGETGNRRLQRFNPRAEAAPTVPCGSDPVACLPAAPTPPQIPPPPEPPAIPPVPCDPNEPTSCLPPATQEE